MSLFEIYRTFQLTDVNEKNERKTKNSLIKGCLIKVKCFHKRKIVSYYISKMVNLNILLFLILFIKHIMRKFSGNAIKNIMKIRHEDNILRLLFEEF